MSPGLAADLRALLARRREETLERGWPEVPPWIFCSRDGTAKDEGNLERAWGRLRRRAQAQSVRPLRLHSTRHTWATHALRAGKSVRWVAAQLGHADPALTLRVYAHAMRDEETDLAFADFGVPLEGPIDTHGRPQTAPCLRDRVRELRAHGKKASRERG
jgi:integrase